MCADVNPNILFLFLVLFLNLTFDLVRAFSVLSKSPFLISSQFNSEILYLVRASGLF